MKQTFVGAGNSGGKQEAMPMDFAAVMLSKKTGRPVRIIHTMEEVLTIGHMRHAFEIDLKIGVDKEGMIKAVDCYAIADGGAHTSVAQLSIYLLGAFLMCTYKVPNVRYEGYRIYTNKAWPGALRGHCAPQARFAFEGLLDDIADELGLDHFENPEENAITPGMKAQWVQDHLLRLQRGTGQGKGLRLGQKKGKLPNTGYRPWAAGFATGANIMGCLPVPPS
jgi:4-hydroxybenzoyl-CoA reductase subunit alpha